MRPDELLVAFVLLRTHNGNLVIAGVALHPSPVFRGAFGQSLRGDRIYPVHIAEEIHDVFGTTQQRQVSLNDNAVETLIYKEQEAFKELREGFHRSSPQMFGWIPTSWITATGGINHQRL